jgi:hypothetical protein
MAIIIALNLVGVSASLPNVISNSGVSQIMVIVSILLIFCSQLLGSIEAIIQDYITNELDISPIYMVESLEFLDF